jgi:Cof subfamily protein (haloacid dehalogenase superfamily)
MTQLQVDRWPATKHAAGVKLVAFDMDGTLLDDNRRIDGAFWGLAERLLAKGVAVCAASGRQHGALVRDFGDLSKQMILIAEGGAHVTIGEDLVSAEAIDPDVVRRAVVALRAMTIDHPLLGAVVSGLGEAFVERGERSFLDSVRIYYDRVTVVDDLLTIDRPVIKVAAFEPRSVRHSGLVALREVAGGQTVALSTEEWADLTRLGTSKGTAIRRVQRRLGIEPSACAAFGDNFNDLPMFEAVGMSFAMANAEPAVVSRAKYRAPSNNDRGVLKVLAYLLEAIDASSPV